MLSLFALLGPISMIVLLVTLGTFSRRLGAVYRRPPVYHVFYVGAILIGVGVAYRITGADATGRADTTSALFYDLTLIVGLFLAVIIAWRYWGWLLSERDADPTIHH